MKKLENVVITWVKTIWKENKISSYIEICIVLPPIKSTCPCVKLWTNICSLCRFYQLFSGWTNLSLKLPCSSQSLRFVFVLNCLYHLRWLLWAYRWPKGKPVHRKKRHYNHMDLKREENFIQTPTLLEKYIFGIYWRPKTYNKLSLNSTEKM